MARFLLPEGQMRGTGNQRISQQRRQFAWTLLCAVLFSAASLPARYVQSSGYEQLRALLEEQTRRAEQLAAAVAACFNGKRLTDGVLIVACKRVP